ncbi:hypothetical protein [Herbaspirillum robiniae]|uniref:hypothetical protein n=1 Tax=Herbaspirillum robiniae TaxID=2014887 RepID=UPI003D76F12F
MNFGKSHQQLLEAKHADSPHPLGCRRIYRRPRRLQQARRSPGRTGRHSAGSIACRSGCNAADSGPGRFGLHGRTGCTFGSAAGRFVDPGYSAGIR